MRIFRVSDRELRPGCRVIEVEGELDLAVAGQLQEVLEKAGAEGDQILIDLSGCEFIDSTGIATILQARQRLADQGRRLAVFGARSQVDKILAITGLSANGLVFETAEEALAAGDDA